LGELLGPYEFGLIDNNYVAWTIGIILAALCLFVYVFFILDLRKMQSFLLFINNNKESLVQGNTIEYERTKLSMKTEVQQYESCITFIFPWPGGIRFDSSYYIKGYHKTLNVAIIYTLGSLLFGWWGVWTIIWIIYAIIRNLRGGHKQTIAQLIT
jgi:hypothetical protein